MFSKNNLTGQFSLKGFQAGRVYRFKFLNNNFDDQTGDVLKITFAYGGCDPNNER